MGSAQVGITTILNGRVMQRLELVKDRILVGRSAECDVRIDHAGVSRTHAAITSKAGSFFVEDLDSSNGTLVNGKPTRIAELQNGDIVQIGSFSLHIGIVASANGSKSAGAAIRREEQTVSLPAARSGTSPAARGGPDSDPRASS